MANYTIPMCCPFCGEHELTFLESPTYKLYVCTNCDAEYWIQPQKHKGFWYPPKRPQGRVI